MQDSFSMAAIADFLALLNQSQASVLMLDYDGTLAPFQTDRNRAYPYPEVLPIISRILQNRRTRVVVVSGRPVQEVQTLLHPLSGIEIRGAHGLERLLEDGTRQTIAIEPEMSALLAQAEEWLRKASLSDRAEMKPGGIAVHWRGLPQNEIKQLHTQVSEGWAQIARHPGLRLLHFDGGLELRTARPHKGDAVTAILKHSPPNMAAAFLGDDLTDEDAFQALNGRGLSVLVRAEFRKTSADAWLRPPQELIHFLDQWLKSISV
jgi:trehalose-phosphatase